MRRLYLFAVFTVLMSSIVIFIAPADAQAIHALLVIMDDAPRTRKLNWVNMKNIGELLQDVEAQYNCPLTLEVLRSSREDNQTQATSENILNWLAVVDPAPDDVVFVYYSGKGGMNKTAARELYLSLQDGDFPRPQIVEAIERLRCRLKMLITDTVSFDVMWSHRSTFAGGGNSEALGHLFFAHEGFLNITSAPEGELSGGASASRSEISDEEILHGGWFTYALIMEIYTSDDDFVSWKAVFRRTRDETIEFSEHAASWFSNGLTRKYERLKQQTQRPIYYGELPRPIIRTTAAPQTLHALLVSMEENLNIENPLIQARDEIEWLLDDMAETIHCTVNITHLFASEGEATAANIQQWLQGVRPGQDDVVFLYYVGDGTADENGELHLDLLDNEKSPRRAIADSLQQLTCRLKILITDAGSHGPPVSDPVDFFEKPLRVDWSKAVSRAKMFKCLFFEHEGFLNLTAATEGEFALENSKGRLFTQALVHTLYNYRSFVISWVGILKLTRQKTMDLFHKEASQLPNKMKQQLREKRVESQRPKYYGELPRRIQQ